MGEVGSYRICVHVLEILLRTLVLKNKEAGSGAT